jgi:P63C domain
MNDEAKAVAARARAEALSPEDRSAIARRAALTRHGKSLPRAVAEGCLFGDRRFPCAVLDDAENTRVLTQEGFLMALGRAGKAKGGEGASVNGKPAFLRAKNLEPFITSELLESMTPLEFIPLRGPGYQGRAFGYRPNLLPEVCWVYQEALISGKLLPSQEHIGASCKAILKALTNRAIEDLIDEATGFDDLRRKRAFFRIIEKYVRKDALPWVKMFDIEYYRQIYRLNGWLFDPDKTARPSVIGHWTNDIYDRLAPGVRGALHERVCRNSRGKPTQKLTQYLTPEEGKPRLKELLEGVKALMKTSSDWQEFVRRLDTVYPRFGDTLQLPFNEQPRLEKRE